MRGLFVSGDLQRNLPVQLATEFDVTAFLDSHGIVMRPVHQPTQVIPFVHPAKSNLVTHAGGHPVGKIDIVRDQQRLPVTRIQNDTLVP